VSSRSLRLAVLVAASPLILSAAPQHFTLSATFVPASKPGAEAVVSVSFVPRDPDVRINEEPAPRLKLDPAQTLLVDKQPPPSGTVKSYDPDTATYLDLSRPVSFPVTLAKGASKGPQTVGATVTYFYCSKREGWCRKGTTEVEFTAP
jgi:hypothetical protein